MVTLLLFVIYIAYISLGLPDSVFGSAWPVMHGDLGVAVSAAGVFTVITALCGAISSFLSGRLIRALGTYKITVGSILLTVAGLFMVSGSSNFLTTCLAALPLGLGAGCIDAALNSFVALNFASRHMNWLHGCWGIGATAGPALLSAVIGRPGGWRTGYRIIGFVQLGIAVIVLASLPLWTAAAKRAQGNAPQEQAAGGRALLRMRGVKAALLVFFVYCGIEYLCGTWAASYCVHANGLTAALGARASALFYLGITVGRLASGFLSVRASNRALTWGGTALLGLGIALLLLPGAAPGLLLAAFLVMGLGCAPLYPCLMHSTPRLFGACNAAAVIGMQNGCALLGGLCMPPLFGLLAGQAHMGAFPLWVLILFAVQTACVARLWHSGNAV